jgi:hypothetical protein
MVEEDNWREHNNEGISLKMMGVGYRSIIRNASRN